MSCARWILAVLVLLSSWQSVRAEVTKAETTKAVVAQAEAAPSPIADKYPGDVGIEKDPRVKSAECRMQNEKRQSAAVVHSSLFTLHSALFTVVEWSRHE